MGADFPFSERGRAGRDPAISWLMARALEVPDLVSLAAGFVDQEALPHRAAARAACDLLADPHLGRAALQYGTTHGDPRLREAVLETLRAGSGAPLWRGVGPEDVVITSGSQQFLYLLAEALLDPGDVVLTEDPSYFVYVGALESFGAVLRGAACDHEGLRPEALEQALESLGAEGRLGRVKLIYLMTYFANPTGVSLAPERRDAVYDLLVRWRERGLRALVVEDAAYRDLRFPAVEDTAPLFERQPAMEWIAYTQSLSKCLSPGLRLGFGLAPRPVRDVILRFKGHHDFGSSNLCQQLALRLVTSGECARHTEGLRERYRRKCALMIETLEAHVPPDLKLDYALPRGGMYVWTTLPKGIETGAESPLFKAALEEKVLYVPGELCAVPTGPEGTIRSVNRRSMRLCYVFPDEATLVEGATRLARALGRVAT